RRPRAWRRCWRADGSRRPRGRAGRAPPPAAVRPSTCPRRTRPSPPRAEVSSHRPPRHHARHTGRCPGGAMPVAAVARAWVAFRQFYSKGTSFAMQPLGHDDPRRIGDYRLLGVLGVGGMGRVYLGRNAGGRTVAVKVIRPDLIADPEFRTRFQREVAAARRVGSSCTAPVLDADVDADPPWLATGYVAGIALNDAVDRFGPFGERSLIVLARGLAEALVAVHEAGVVHRDLKPSNVLLAIDGPKVIDFGIARAVEDTALTTTGKVIGSPAFMCPEQVTGEPVGPAGDMFALGGVLTYAATGQGPFGGGDTVQL